MVAVATKWTELMKSLFMYIDWIITWVVSVPFLVAFTNHTGLVSAVIQNCQYFALRLLKIDSIFYLRKFSNTSEVARKNNTNG